MYIIEAESVQGSEVKDMFNVITLAGVIIASRELPKPWGLVVGVVLIVLGFFIR